MGAPADSPIDTLQGQTRALHRLALAVARPDVPSGDLAAALAREVAAALDAALVVIAGAQVADGAGQPEGWAPRAAVLRGRLTTLDADALAGLPWSTTGEAAFSWWPQGVVARCGDASLAGREGLDAGASLVWSDGEGRPCGRLWALDPQRVGGGDESFVRAVLEIAAQRLGSALSSVPPAPASPGRSEAACEAIFEASDDAIFLHDWDTGRIIDANRQASVALGWSHDELVGLSVAEICAGMPPYTAADAMRWLALARQDACPPFEWRRRNKDGSLHWDEVRLKPALIEGRRCVVAFSRDITERKHAMAAVQAQEQKYRAIFDGSVDSMVLWDAGLRVVDVNRAFVQLTGLQRSDVVGRHWTERPDTDNMRRIVALVRSALEGQEVRAVEHVAHVDGRAFDVELRYLPVSMGHARFALGIGRDVTDQLAHERALAGSAARLRATVEAAFDAVIGMDGDGRIIEFSAAAERTFGYRRDEVVGRLLSEVLLPERHRKGHADGLERFRRHGHGTMVGRLVETTALHAQGHEIPVELAISTAAVPEGIIFVGHLRDITERRRAEQGLRDSEEHYRGIYNAVADALVLRDANFAIVDVNDTYEAMSGYRRAEVLGVARILANPPEAQAEVRALHARALAGEPVSLTTQLVRRDGERYDLELRAVPIQHRGQPHVLYIGRDITRDKRTELALRDSEVQYRAMFNATADALILRDADFHAVEVNPAYCELSGFSREEVLRSDSVLMQGQSAMQDRHRLEHAHVLAGEPLRFEATARRKDGQAVPIEVRGVPVSYRGRPHVLYALRDMTERVAADQRRSELERQLRQAQKMEAIGQLTGGIAHDFNNILASVIGYLVLAQERAESISDATLVRQLGQAHLAADRARELIAQMLAFARRQRGERRVLALTPLVQQTITLLRATLPSTVTLDVDLPDEAGTPWVEADPVQLEQVLLNLCINARDAVRGQGRIAVRLGRASPSTTWHCASCRAAVTTGDWAELHVEDDGEGMDAEVQERIFDPFFSTKAPGEGSGMGLAMVHGIAHDHGGHIQLVSSPGQGTRFSLWLPLSAPAATPSALAGPHAGAPAPLSGRVLLVEDDTMVGDFLTERLRGWGLDVRLERVSTAAADWLDDPAHAVDLLVTDQTMPRMTGLQLAARVHAARPRLPILLVSGNADAFDPHELARCGVGAALRKPVDEQQLRAVLRRLLTASSAVSG